MMNPKKILLMLMLTTLILGMMPPGFVIADPPNALDVNGVDAYLIDSFDDYTKYGYNVHKVVEPFLYRSEVLCEAHLPMVYNLNLKKAIPLTEKNYINEFLTKTESGKQGFDTINYSYFILINESYKRNIAIYEKGFYHDINGTHNITNVTYKMVDDYRYVWKEIKSLKELSLNTGYVIVDIVGHFKAGTTYKKIDIVPWVKIGSFQKQFSKYAWWNSSWQYKKKITIDKDFVDDPLDNHVVRVQFANDSQLYSHAQQDYEDIVFTDATEGIILAHHVEEWDWDAVNSDVSAEIWVNASWYDSASDTEIYMYYGNAGASSYENITETWDIYEARWNMTDNSTSTIPDSTVHEWNGSKGSANHPNEIDADIYKAQDFDHASDDRITLGSDSVFRTANFSMEAWIWPEDTSAYGAIFSKFPTSGSPDTYSGWMIGHSEDDLIWRQGGSTEDNIKGLSCIVEDCYQFIAGTENTTRNVSMYHNTSFVAQDVVQWGLTTTDGAVIGAYYWTASGGYVWPFDGLIDEARFARFEANQSWLNFTYHTLNYSNGFITIGTEETSSLGQPVTMVNVTSVEETTVTANGQRSITPTGPWSCGFWLNDEAYGVDDSNDDQNVTVGNYNENEYFNYGFSGLSEGQIHSVRAWAVNGSIPQFNASAVNVTFLTKPLAPTDFQIDIAGETYMNMSWTVGTGSNYTHIVRKAGGIPADRADGTNVYNDTGTFYNDTLPGSDVYFYRAWGFTNWTVGASAYSRWSDSYADCASSGLVISVYNESDLSAITGWDVFISDHEGNQVYNESNCTNPHSILNASVPTGENIQIVISNTSYKTRVYYVNIESGTIQQLNAFLPPENDAVLIYFKVIDEYENSVDGAKVSIKKYLNETFDYQNITIGLTDGYGYFNCYLIEEHLYKAVISKDNYETAYADFFASETQTFKLYSKDYTGEDLWTNITWSIEPTIFDHYTNITFYFNITSSDDMLEWYNMTVAYYNETSGEYEIISYQNTTGDLDGGSLTYMTGNTTGKYSLRCAFKKENYDPYFFGYPYTTTEFIYHIWGDSGGDAGDLDTILTGAMGKSPVFVGETVIAYTSLIAAFVVTFLLFTFSPKFAGFSIMVMGLVLGAFKEPLHIISDDVINGTAVAALVILGFITILYMWKKG